MLICVMDNVINFLRFNYSKLIFAGLLLWCFIAWWDDHKAKQQKFRQLEREEEEREEYRARMDYGSTKDATYIEEGKILFDVSKELGGLGIVPPMRLSNLYSPSRTIPKMNGAFFFCLFLLQKDREVVDTELIRHTLQTKIDQRLTAGEYPGVDAKYTYRGRTYSGFVIDRVRDDSGGGFVEVYTVLVNNAYCRYKQDRALSGDAPSTFVDRRDVDY